MPARKVAVLSNGVLPLISESYKHAVTVCPKCGREAMGPHDTLTNARHLFTRTYWCKHCWWNRELEMKDDIGEAAKKHAAAVAKKQKSYDRAHR